MATVGICFLKGSNEAAVAVQIFFNFLFQLTTPIKLCLCAIAKSLGNDEGT